MKNAKKTVALAAALLLGVIAYLTNNGMLPTRGPAVPAAVPQTHTVADAFRNRQSDVQVEGQGNVSRILPDDREGSRHQRFVLRATGVHTVLVVHNIDLAPRINALREGDTVAFYGEYEWNDKGGVIHWTHHDPAGRHVDGWLRHNGRIYQ